MKLGLLGPGPMSRPGPPLQQSKQYVGEARPPGLAEYSATTKSEFAESSGESEAGSSWSRAKCTTSAANTAVAKSVGEGRFLGIAKYNVTSESELAKSSAEAGSSGTRANDTTIADVTAVEKSVGEIRPLSLNVSPESELAEYFGADRTVPPLQQSQTLLMKLSLLGLQSTVP